MAVINISSTRMTLSTGKEESTFCWYYFSGWLSGQYSGLSGAIKRLNTQNAPSTLQISKNGEFIVDNGLIGHLVQSELRKG
jgi:hypothetical protein